MSESPNAFQKLLDFLDRLEQKNIHFRLHRIRNETIMVGVAVPGEYWEIEFFADGQVETEIFSNSTGVLSGDEPIERLFREFSD
jgi:hypothetical protein